MSASLPVTLTRNLADAEVEVVAWSAAKGELVLRLSKDISREIGLLRFCGVSRVNLVPRLTLGGLVSSEQPVPGFAGVEPDPGESLFVLEDAWGAAYFVLAESINYEVQA
jgi:hypothetical protein